MKKEIANEMETKLSLSILGEGISPEIMENQMEYSKCATIPDNFTSSPNVGSQGITCSLYARYNPHLRVGRQNLVVDETGQNVLGVQYLLLSPRYLSTNIRFHVLFHLSSDCWVRNYQALYNPFILL